MDLAPPLDAALLDIRDAAVTLSTVPHRAVEPTMLYLVVDAVTLGRVCAPAALTADDFDVEAASRFARPRPAVLLCTLVPKSVDPTLSASDLQALLNHTSTLWSADVFLDASTEHPTGVNLPAIIASSDSGISVSVIVPDDIPTKPVPKVHLRSLTLAGKPLTTGLPIAVAVSRFGVHAPMDVVSTRIQSLTTPVISPSGIMYVPMQQGGIAFAADGTPLSIPGYPSNRIPQSSSLAYCAASDTLLLADAYGSSNKVVALDVRSGVILWETPPGAFNNLTGLAVLEHDTDPARSVVFVSSFNTDSLHAYRISDGTEVTSVKAPPRLIFLAVDPRSRNVYASVGDGVIVFRWDFDLQRLDPAGHVDGVNSTNRPLTVVQDAGGGGPYLVVCDQGNPNVQVYSIPSHSEYSLREVAAQTWQCPLPSPLQLLQPSCTALCFPASIRSRVSVPTPSLTRCSAAAAALAARVAWGQCRGGTSCH